MKIAILIAVLVASCTITKAQFIGGMSGIGRGVGLGGGGGGGAACAGNLVLDYTNACNLMTQMTGF